MFFSYFISQFRWERQAEKASGSITATLNNDSPFRVRLKNYSLDGGSWIKIASAIPAYSRDSSCLVGGSVFSDSKGGLVYVIEADSPHELQFDWKNATALFSTQKTETRVEEFSVYQHKFKLYTSIVSPKKNTVDISLSLVYQGQFGPFSAPTDAPRDLKSATVPRVPSSEIQHEPDQRGLPLGATFHKVGAAGRTGSSGQNAPPAPGYSTHGSNGGEGERGASGSHEHLYEFTLSGYVNKVHLSAPLNITTDGMPHLFF